MMKLRSCVGIDGNFIVGIHTPSFLVKNLRDHAYIESLGCLEDGTPVENQVNFIPMKNTSAVAMLMDPRVDGEDKANPKYRGP